MTQLRTENSTEGTWKSPQSTEGIQRAHCKQENCKAFLLENVSDTQHQYSSLQLRNPRNIHSHGPEDGNKVMNHSRVPCSGLGVFAPSLDMKLCQLDQLCTD